MKEYMLSDDGCDEVIATKRWVEGELFSEKNWTHEELEKLRTELLAFPPYDQITQMSAMANAANHMADMHDKLISQEMPQLRIKVDNIRIEYEQIFQKSIEDNAKLLRRIIELEQDYEMKHATLWRHIKTTIKNIFREQ